MSQLFNFLPQEIMSSLGWTLLHSLWQGGILALVLYFSLYYLRTRSANVKAFLAAASLALLLVSSAVTYYVEYNAVKSADEVSSFVDTASPKPLFENPVDVNNLDKDITLFSKIYNEFQVYFRNNVNLIVSLWMLGFIFFAIRFAGGVFYTARMRRNFAPIEDLELIKKIELLRRSAGVKRGIQVAESAMVKVPIVLGYIKPMILLPFGLLGSIPVDQVEAIIAHEIAHIKRYDILINLFQSVAEIVFFFNPAVWYISHKIKMERENACDDMAISLCGDSVLYAKALANAESFKESNEPLFAIPLFKNQNQLLRRIKRMLQKDQNQNGFKEKFAAALIFMGILVVAAVIKNVAPASGNTDSQFNKAGITFPSSIFVGGKELSNIEIDTTKAVHGKRSFSYFQKEDGKMKRYRARIKDGKLTDLTIDGEKVAQDKLDSYRKDVEEAYSKLDNEDYFFAQDMFPRGGFFPDSLKHFTDEISKSFNSKEFRQDMEKMQKEIAANVKEHFNSEEFKKEMEKVQKEIKENASKWRMDFNSDDMKKTREQMRKEMQKVKEELRKENFRHDSEFNSEEFEKKMEKLGQEIEEKMKDIDVKHLESLSKLESLKGLEHLKSLESLKTLGESMKHNEFAMKGFEKGMKEFNVKMKGFGEKMKVFGEKMKIFGKFMKEVKDMLVDEKLVDADDDHLNINIKKDGLYLDGKKQSDAVFEKAKKIYKKFYNKEFDGKFDFEVNN